MHIPNADIAYTRLKVAQKAALADVYIESEFFDSSKGRQNRDGNYLSLYQTSPQSAQVGDEVPNIDECYRRNGQQILSRLACLHRMPSAFWIAHEFAKGLLCRQRGILQPRRVDVGVKNYSLPPVSRPSTFRLNYPK
jgi:hypothetical protein